MRKASYGRRIVAGIIDGLFNAWPMLIALVVLIAAIANTPGALDNENVELTDGWATAVGLSIVVGGLASLGLTIMNSFVRQGRTGQSLGKRKMNLALVDANTGTNVGGWKAVGRYVIASALGSVTCNVFTLLDILWPLWDKRGQRVVDKMLSTVVVPCDDPNQIRRK